MSREPRVIVAGGIYHIYARGNNKRNIFHDSVDRYWYIQLLAKCAREYASQLFVYMLMSNHIHLILRVKNPNLDKLVHSLHGPYAARFNRRHGLVGHTFASRYRSKLITEDVYLLNATRYIHRNPIRAGLVARPEDYPWSSYRYYVRRGHSEALVDPTPVLSLLSSDATRQCAAYEQFVLAEVPSG